MLKILFRVLAWVLILYLLQNRGSWTGHVQSLLAPIWGSGPAPVDPDLGSLSSRGLRFDYNDTVDEISKIISNYQRETLVQVKKGAVLQLEHLASALPPLLVPLKLNCSLTCTNAIKVIPSIQEMVSYFQTRPETECNAVLFYLSQCTFSSQTIPHFHVLAKAFPTMCFLAVREDGYNKFTMNKHTYNIPSLFLFHGPRPVLEFKGPTQTLTFMSKFIQLATGLVPKSPVNFNSKDLQEPILKGPGPPMSWARFLVLLCVPPLASARVKQILFIIKQLLVWLKGKLWFNSK